MMKHKMICDGEWVSFCESLAEKKSSEYRYTNNNFFLWWDEFLWYHPHVPRVLCYTTKYIYLDPIQTIISSTTILSIIAVQTFSYRKEWIYRMLVKFCVCVYISTRRVDIKIISIQEEGVQGRKNEKEKKGFF